LTQRIFVYHHSSITIEFQRFGCTMPPHVQSVVRELRKESRSASRFTGRRVHFIGIGGCGMSGLARMLLDNGAIVTGSEPKPNQQTFDLAARGVKITRDQIGQLLSRETDLVVRTAAVADSNLEFKAAERYGVETIKYAELLGQVMAERFGVAVAGTHGKSTTTAMIAFALHECGADPSFVVGGTVPQLGNAGARSGQSDLFVAEACEYARSFHHLDPKVALITNIEKEHLDCYRDIYDIIEAFRKFANKVPSDGAIIANGRDKHVAATLRDVLARVETVSLTPGTTWSTCPTGLHDGCPTGAITRDGKPIGMLQLSVAGEHNLFNATMAVAACAACGVAPADAADAVSRFTGVERRMQIVGTFNGATVVDDYGHHPTEIRATLRALRERFKPTRLICVFQPHQGSRTRILFDEFATSFADADVTIMPDIYFVRDSEAERQQVSSTLLAAAINASGQTALHLPKFREILEHLRGEVRAGDLVVTMGAGNVWEIGRELVG
jgi:UDP-N-acetylmuramate--alanine ligase